MVAMKISRFGGSAPLISRRLLPEMMAQVVTNAYLKSGELRPIRSPVHLHQFAGPAVYRRAVRIPDPNAPQTPVWMPFVSRFAAIYRNPLVNDAFRRFIWLDNNGPGSPQRLVQNTLARIKNGDPPYLLGVPEPQAAPTVNVTGGDVPVVTRSYAYTLVNIFGEEGQPSPATLASGNITGTWAISGLALPPGVDATVRGIAHFRIYRTLTGQLGTQFFRVADVPVATTSYSDTRPDSEVAAESLILPSASWREPEEFEGFTAMPNGFFIAWRGKDVFFSEPYRPHAWPAEYITAVANEIVAGSVFGQTFVALTTVSPVLITGNSPSNISQESTEIVEPCASPNGAIPTPQGVFYVGATGLILVSPGGMVNVTENIIGQEEWQRQYVTDFVGGTLFDGQLLAIRTQGRGYQLDLANREIGLVDLVNLPEIESVWTDSYTGEVHFMVDNSVYQWGNPRAVFGVADWLSREYEVPIPINFGALKVRTDTTFDIGYISDLPIEEESPPTGGPWLDQACIFNYTLFNTTVINGAPENGTPPPGNPGAVGFPYWFGLNPVPVLSSLPPGVGTFVFVYANGNLVWQGPVQDGQMYRLSSGFKSDLWQVQIKTRVPVLSIALAENGKELRTV
jgi:hypothetical protein